MKSKTKKRLKWLAITLSLLGLLLMLFVAAFVFNPFEGRLRDVRDVVPREVDFFLRKTAIAGDFAGGRLHLTRDALPVPAFWTALTESAGWQELRRGPLLGQLDRDYTGLLQKACDSLLQVQEGSGGFLDVSRDLIGSEVVVAGYFEDKTKQPAQPLQQPWWCLYARVGWRLRAAWGLLTWSLVQGQVKQSGIDVHAEDELLVIRAPGATEPFYANRQLDCLMLSNSKQLLAQAVRLAAGSDQEEPFGQTARYTDGVVQPVQRWASINSDGAPNALEFSLAPNTIDAFRRVSSVWPNGKNQDSMNERVLASFLNLTGWNSVSGALLFEPARLSVLGEIVLNSHKHTGFQASFYRAESQQRKDWLDPFLHMVPDDACAAAALRMPAGEFLHAMYDALLDSERELFNDAIRRCSWNGTPIASVDELLDKLKIAFLPRTGFVFRKNVPDTARDVVTGQLQVPVLVPSPVPQVAWLFWIKEGSNKIAQNFVDMLRDHAGVFHFAPVYHMKVEESFPEMVTEFANSGIPGTGEVAMIVFSDFFVVSNSGPLVKDILRTRYRFGSNRPITDREEYQLIARELPQSLNGFVWLDGGNLLKVFDDYRTASEKLNLEPDPEWKADQRASAEEVVRRQKFPLYPTVASMPKELQEGAFEDAIKTYLQEQWSKGATGLSTKDLPAIDQMRGFCKLLDTAYLQVELENNYIRFAGKAVGTF